MILLDTRVVLWAMKDDPLLGPGTRSLIVDSSPRYVSAVSHAELVLQTMRGQVGVPADLPRLLAGAGFTHLALEDRHPAGLRSFENFTPGRELARLLLAQALVDRLSFLTADPELLALDLPWIHDATH